VHHAEAVVKGKLSMEICGVTYPNCNKAMGLLGDSPELLQKLAAFALFCENKKLLLVLLR